VSGAGRACLSAKPPKPATALWVCKNPRAIPVAVNGTCGSADPKRNPPPFDGSATLPFGPLIETLEPPSRGVKLAIQLSSPVSRLL